MGYSLTPRPGLVRKSFILFFAFAFFVFAWA